MIHITETLSQLASRLRQAPEVSSMANFVIAPAVNCFLGTLEMDRSRASTIIRTFIYQFCPSNRESVRPIGVRIEQTTSNTPNWSINTAQLRWARTAQPAAVLAGYVGR